MPVNPLLATDFYKIGHISQYPEGTELVYSNLTPRSDKRFNGSSFYDHKVVVFGIQGFIQEFLVDMFDTYFFQLPIAEVIEQYQKVVAPALGEENAGVSHFIDLHTLGYLPIRIKALPEGSRVGMKVPVMTIENTRPEFFWLVNYLETVISAMVWKPMTNATIAYEYRRILDHYADATGSDKFFVNFQAHDFSARGMSGIEDAVRSGAAHLTSFMGTDTVGAIEYVNDYYPSPEGVFIAGSVPATEHSVMCMGGQESEIETYRRLIEDIYPNGIVSIVSDTWDFWQVMTDYTVQLKDKILARDGKVVFRPDSGDPVKILTGYMADEVVLAGDGSYYRVEDLDRDQYGAAFIVDGAKSLSVAEVKGAVEVLWDIFGGDLTEGGYKVLDSHVGLIYGDSITLARCEDILERLKAKGFASGNVVFGVGSFTYQYNTRDTFGFAVKATFGVVNGVPRELFKDPKTDDGTKKSARGLIRVDLENGEYILRDQMTRQLECGGQLKVVFENGEVYNQTSLDEIRQRLKAAF